MAFVSRYRDRAGIDSRANSALLRIGIVSPMWHIPSAVRLVWIAEIMAGEPILTDDAPASHTVRELAAEIKAHLRTEAGKQ